VIWVVIVTIVKDCCKETPKVEQSKQQQPKQQQRRKSGSSRMVWLDNIKLALICGVIIGHGAMNMSGGGVYPLGFNGPDGVAAGGTTWLRVAFYALFPLIKAVAVPNFFFISGYFAATGPAKKGAAKFLCGSLRRLGPAWLLFTWVLNPLMVVVARVIVQLPFDGMSLYPNSAHGWFLSWLLFFNCGYAIFSEQYARAQQQHDEEQQTGPSASPSPAPELQLTDPVAAPPAPPTSVTEPSSSPAPEDTMPSFLSLVVIGLVAGLLQAGAAVVCLLGLSYQFFAGMPMVTAGDGLFSAVFYSGGILARKRGWFTQPTPSRLLIPSVVCVVVSAVVAIVTSILLFGPGMPLYFVDSLADITAGYFLANIVVMAPYGFSFTVCCFTFSRKYCVCSNKFMAFLTGGSFAVYLIHYWVVMLMTWAYVIFLREVPGINVKFVNQPRTTGNVTYLYNSTTSSTPIGAGYYALGLCWVIILSLVVCFAIGGALKKIPGLGNYL